MTYKATPIGVDQTANIPGTRVGGFIAATAGTVQFIIRDGGNPPVTFPAVPLAAGQEWDIEFYAGTTGLSTIVLAGGCSGILFTS
jgi:hypothetical protein